jgi:hypothetical protein
MRLAASLPGRVRITNHLHRSHQHILEPRVIHLKTLNHFEELNSHLQGVQL